MKLIAISLFKSRQQSSAGTRMSARVLIFAVALCAFVVDGQESAFEKDGLVPDILDASPPGTLQIRYPSGVAVQDGNELTPRQVKEQPEVTWTANPDKFYTLIMSDPDAPSRKLPAFREIRHWLVVNTPGNNLSEGEVISAYMGSGPPPGTGLHRYAFILYEQPGKLTFDDEVRDLTATDPTSRISFSTKGFATKYNLGSPVAGNFYQAKWDSSVSRPSKQLIEHLKAQGIDLSALDE